ncbi:hypothetical protein PENTCL1PPCAC_28157, partial [Pristionchus entomophagus]
HSLSMLFSALCCIVVLLMLPEWTSSAKFPVVTTSYGSLKGYSFTAEDGTEAQIFKRIPFASPPIGDLRWKKPQPHQPWNGTRDSTFFGPACPQKSIVYDGSLSGFSEDCLHLNVYTSKDWLEPNSSCPVVFIIHGGLTLFEATMAFPDETLVRNFVSQGIVVVSTAYRLGVFGVMALGDENVLPANLALHDVLAALKFTRQEIGHFGGDKERITLLGHSAGGQIALMAAFSPGISKPGEKRLFNSVISMSGPSGLESQEETVQRSHAFVTELACEGSASEIMACLRVFDTETIIDAAFKFLGKHVLSGKGPIGVTMAGELFPINSQRELRERKDPIRIMMGTTIFENPGTSEVGVERVSRFLGIENSEECSAKYDVDTLSGQFVPGYDVVSQDIILTAHVFTKYQAEIGGEAYLYEYDYPVHGNHTQDASFVLGYHQFETDENEKWLSHAYPRYFANFIKGQRPAPEWSPVTPLLMNYYSVNKSISDDVFPHTRYGYQKNLVTYYEGLVKYDNALSLVKNKILSAPVQYKSLNFDG